LLAVPIYNFDCGAAAKNLIELTGRSWEDKTVGFLCAAGGRSSYMSIMSVANSLMLDFRCLIIPRFVYADGSAFEGGAITDPEIRLRVEQLVESAVRLNGASIPKVAASK
jgi:FMN reductase